MRRVLFLLATLTTLPAQAAPSIVAAENMYGDVAAQVAGPDATVTSILSNPNQDPHLFEATPAVARALAGAAVVICNGAGYDPWMDGLLAAGRTPGRQVITAATLMGRHPGDNPHLWYDPATLRAVTAALAAVLAAQDPPHAAGYAARGEAFAATLDRLDAQIAALRARHTGVSVAATEPVFDLMAVRLGLVVRDGRFALAVMNGAEPRMSDTAAFEDDLRRHRVRALLYNGQTSSAATQRLLGIARAAGVPVVPVTETEPAGTTYQAWMAAELDALDRALSPPGFVTPSFVTPGFVRMNAVALDGVTLGFGGRTVLQDVSLAMPDGAFVGVLGANGAGKTTLMRALLGLVTPRAGSIRVLDRPASRGNPAVGYLPQSRTAARSRVDGWSFVASAAAGHRWGPPLLGAAGRAEVARVIGLVGAEDLARRPLAALSGGERQRLLLAQALLGRPRLLLLDEPLAGLDPHHGAAAIALVRRVQRELGLTVLLSAHDINPLLGVMDQVLYLAGGGAALGQVAEVVTGPVLSRLYHAPIEVVQVGGRIFVLPGVVHEHMAQMGAARGRAVQAGAAHV